MVLKGVAGSEGICIGKAYIFVKETMEISSKKINENEIETEIEKIAKAVESSKKDVRKIRERVEKKSGRKNAEIFDAHLLMLDDCHMMGLAKSAVQDEKLGAAAAVHKSVRQISKMFQMIDDKYFSARANDIEDIGNRLVRHISGVKTTDLSDIGEQSIIVSHDLTPSDTAMLDTKFVSGMVCEIGSRTSHTVILARSIGIPAVVGINSCTKNIKNGDMVIVDGFSGEVIVNPDKKVVDKYKLLQEKHNEHKKKLKKLISLPAQTLDGRIIEISGNVGSLDDVDAVVKNGGDAVGLFRTEFFYMDKQDFPTEEEQFLSYKSSAQKLGEKPLIIRTMDIGGDKNLPYFNLTKENNPFLGYRAIRICLDMEDMFRTQLRAILRASAFGKVRIMFPMISNIDEFRKAKNIVISIKDELRREGTAFDEDVLIGIMVEVPATAIQAKTFAKEVDFFSIGTNDLCQYTLAVDRMNEKVADLYHPLHPAVLWLIKNVIDAAKENGIMVGMCGEMASGKREAYLLLGLGLESFSMSTSSMLEIKELIRKINYEDAKKVAEYALNLATGQEVATYIEKAYNELGVI